MFYFEPGDARGYADKIELLNKERTLLKKIGDAGIKKANELFDPVTNTSALESNILKTDNAGIKNKNPVKAYDSRLDNQLIPNNITRLFRSVTK